MGLAEQAAKAAKEQQDQRAQTVAQQRTAELSRQKAFLQGAFGIEPIYVGKESVDTLEWKTLDSFTRQRAQVVKPVQRDIYLVDDIRVAIHGRNVELILQDVQHGQYVAGDIYHHPFKGDGYTGDKTEYTTEERLAYAAKSIGRLLTKKHPAYEASGRVCESCGQVIL